jgi:hypothetical protein
LGPEDKDDKAIRILNRVVSWDSEGIKYEPDQRHAEVIIEQLGVKAKQGIATPGVKPADAKDEEGDDENLGPTDATCYRAAVARPPLGPPLGPAVVLCAGDGMTASLSHVNF